MTGVFDLVQGCSTLVCRNKRLHFGVDVRCEFSLDAQSSICALGVRGMSSGRQTPRDPDDYYGCPVSKVLVFFLCICRLKSTAAILGGPGPHEQKRLESHGKPKMPRASEWHIEAECPGLTS